MTKYIWEHTITALIVLVSFSMAGCNGPMSPTQLTKYPTLMVAQKVGLTLRVGTTVCFAATGGDGHYTWNLIKGYGTISPDGCFTPLEIGDFTIEVTSGDGQKADANGAVLPSICDTGSIVVSINQPAPYYLTGPTGQSIGWTGSNAFVGVALGTWSIATSVLQGYTVTVTPANSGMVTGCGTLNFTVTYTPR